ncbi:hypothetical protein SUNI508_10760 [Seiridium unicorne]|uniref:Deoxyribonuclease NucA/NucB domain-containing protein n=1 Tax=Seiridium unicorne TaxID=138068 RepID=A0ABR2UJM1_9PEZI
MNDCKSIDEYPFAGSKEGGFAYQNVVVALRCIPLADQNSQGGHISGIASSQTTDTWTVQLNGLSHVTGPNFPAPANTWCSPNPSRQNDGHQLVPDDGRLVLDDPNKWIKRDGNISSHTIFSEDGDSAIVRVGVEDDHLVGIPFEG